MKPSNLVAKLAPAAESESTRRSYAADLRHFKSCGGRIPATAEMVANYLAKNSTKLAVATLEHRLVAIHKSEKLFPRQLLFFLCSSQVGELIQVFQKRQRRRLRLLTDFGCVSLPKAPYSRVGKSDTLSQKETRSRIGSDALRASIRKNRVNSKSPWARAASDQTYARLSARVAEALYLP
jgi:hypothetical protein